MQKDIALRGLYVLLVILVVVIAIVGYNIFFTTNEVELYFSDSQGQYLIPETRDIDSDNLYEDTINELIKGPKDDELAATIPEEAELIEVKLENKLLTVNFTEDLIEFHPGGSTGERMTVYSIVNTLTNFTEVEQVQILVADEKRPTLSGHLMIEEPIEFNYDIVKE